MVDIFKYFFSPPAEPINITSIDDVNKTSSHGQKVFRKIGGAIQLVDRPVGWRLWFLSHDHREQYREGAKSGATDLIKKTFDDHARTRFETYYQGRDWVNHPLDVKTFNEFVEHEKKLRENTIPVNNLQPLESEESKFTLETIRDRLQSSDDNAVIIGATTREPSKPEKPSPSAPAPASFLQQESRSKLQIAKAWFGSSWQSDSTNLLSKTILEEADKKDQGEGRRDGIIESRAAVEAAFPEGVLGKESVLKLFDQSFSTTPASGATAKTELKVSELKSFLEVAILARKEANTMFEHAKQMIYDEAFNWENWITESAASIEKTYSRLESGKMKKDIVKSAFRFLIDVLRPEIIAEMKRDAPEIQAALEEKVKQAVKSETSSLERKIEDPFIKLRENLEKYLNQLGT